MVRLGLDFCFAHRAFCARLIFRRADADIGGWRGGAMENGLVSPSVEGTPQGGPLTPLTQKVISSLKEQSRDGEKGAHCLIFVVNSSTFMAHGALDQGEEGSPAECRSWPAAA